MADSPTDLYCRWYETLAPAVAEELAIALIQLFPGGALESPIAITKASDGLLPRIRRMASTPPRDAGLALSLAAITDFVFLEQSDPDAWERHEAMLELLEDAQEQLGAPSIAEQFNSWIQENKLRQPLRARQWMKESESWRALRAGALAPESVRKMLRVALVEAMRPQ